MCVCVRARIYLCKCIDVHYSDPSSLVWEREEERGRDNAPHQKAAFLYRVMRAWIVMVVPRKSDLLLQVLHNHLKLTPLYHIQEYSVIGVTEMLLQAQPQHNERRSSTPSQQQQLFRRVTSFFVRRDLWVKLRSSEARAAPSQKDFGEEDRPAYWCSLCFWSLSKRCSVNFSGCAELLIAIPVSNAACELGFSTLKLIKNHLRTTMTDERLRPCPHVSGYF